jgi:hypothetical protein
MPSSETWRRVGLVITDVSEERVASHFRVEKSENEEKLSSEAQFRNVGSHKTHQMALFIVTAVRTSNPAESNQFSI